MSKNCPSNYGQRILSHPSKGWWRSLSKWWLRLLLRPSKKFARSLALFKTISSHLILYWVLYPINWVINNMVHLQSTPSRALGIYGTSIRISHVRRESQGRMLIISVFCVDTCVIWPFLLLFQWFSMSNANVIIVIWSVTLNFTMCQRWKYQQVQIKYTISSLKQWFRKNQSTRNINWLWVKMHLS